MRIFKRAHTLIYNFLRMNDYSRAEDVSVRLTGILRSWKMIKAGGGKIIKPSKKKK